MAAKDLGLRKAAKFSMDVVAPASSLSDGPTNSRQELLTAECDPLAHKYRGSGPVRSRELWGWYLYDAAYSSFYSVAAVIFFPLFLSSLAASQAWWQAGSSAPPQCSDSVTSDCVQCVAGSGEQLKSATGYYCTNSVLLLGRLECFNRALHCTALHHSVLHCTASLCTELLCIALHCTSTHGIMMLWNVHACCPLNAWTRRYRALHCTSGWCTSHAHCAAVALPPIAHRPHGVPFMTIALNERSRMPGVA